MREKGRRGYATCCKVRNIAPEASFAAIFLAFHHQPSVGPFSRQKTAPHVAKRVRQDGAQNIIPEFNENENLFLSQIAQISQIFFTEKTEPIGELKGVADVGTALK